MIEALRQKFSANRFEFSQHAVDASMVRRISVEEIRQVVANCKVIEDYPEDKYGPSCLLYGRTLSGRPIHIHCSHPTRDPVKIITVYQPDPDSWTDFSARR
jgi:hypothetical protein